MIPKVLAVIPARIESSRFPGKPLAKINGRPMLEIIWKELIRAKRIDRVVIATDSPEIEKKVAGFGGETIKTSKKHRTGSDRAAEAAVKLGGGIIINIQADSIGLKAREYDRVIYAMLNDSAIKYATIARKIENIAVLDDPNRVKVVADENDNALWFSRYPIPYLQGGTKETRKEFPYLYHIGVYFFRRAALLEFSSWKRGPLEKAESLEQLRILENGRKLRLFRTKSKIYSVDTPKDLKALENINL